MRDETPEEGLQRYLRENPPAPRVVPRQSPIDRAVLALVVVGSAVFWLGIGYASLRLLLD